MLAGFAAALLWTTPASAQRYKPPGETWTGLTPLTSGAFQEMGNQARAEHLLSHREQKLTRHAAQGNPVAVERDLDRINHLRFRISVDQWLIQKHLCDNPGRYPYPVHLDPLSCAVIGQYRRP